MYILKYIHAENRKFLLYDLINAAQKQTFNYSKFWLVMFMYKIKIHIFY